MKKVDMQNGKKKKSYLIRHRLKFSCYITDYILTFFPQDNHKIILKINFSIYKLKYLQK